MKTHIIILLSLFVIFRASAQQTQEETEWVYNMFFLSGTYGQPLQIRTYTYDKTGQLDTTTWSSGIIETWVIDANQNIKNHKREKIRSIISVNNFNPPARVEAGEHLNLSAQVVNSGNWYAKDIYADLYVKNHSRTRSPLSEPYFCGSFFIDSLPAQDTITAFYEFNLPANLLGTYYFELNVYSNSYIDTINVTDTTIFTVYDCNRFVATTPTVHHDYCGTHTGSIKVNTENGYPPYTYNFSPFPAGAILQGDSLYNLPGGIYNVVITDRDSCQATYTGIFIRANDPISINNELIIRDSNNNCTGSISYNPAGGSNSYTYLWNDGATTQNRNNLCAGTYELTITDSENCSFSKSFTIENTVGIDETENFFVKIYPNPTTGYITIEANEIIQQIVIGDVTGRIIIQKNDINQSIFNCQIKQKGVFLVKVQFFNKIYTEKIIVK